MRSWAKIRKLTACSMVFALIGVGNAAADGGGGDPVVPPIHEQYLDIALEGSKECNYGNPGLPNPGELVALPFGELVFEEWTAPRNSKQFYCQCSATVRGCSYKATERISCPAGFSRSSSEAECRPEYLPIAEILLIDRLRWGPFYESNPDERNDNAQECQDSCESVALLYALSAGSDLCPPPPNPTLFIGPILCSGKRRDLPFDGAYTEQINYKRSGPAACEFP